METYGSATGSLRTQAQTDVALFWEPAANIQYIQIVRALIADKNRSLIWDTRFVAAFQIVTTDAQISIYNAKYEYVRWRPVTAIQAGSPGVTAIPGWTPLFTTPTYPEYPSGHGGYAGAAQQVLDAFVGPRAPEPIAVTSPNDPGVPQSLHELERGHSPGDQRALSGRESTSASQTRPAPARVPRWRAGTSRVSGSSACSQRASDAGGVSAPGKQKLPPHRVQVGARAGVGR